MTTSLATKAERRAEAAEHWLDNSHPDAIRIALVYMLYAVVLALLAIAEAIREKTL